jgi:hypothetical protein
VTLTRVARRLRALDTMLSKEEKAEAWPPPHFEARAMAENKTRAMKAPIAAFLKGLDDIELGVLEELVAASVAWMREKHKS